jgi:hypothetical protein
VMQIDEELTDMSVEEIAEGKLSTSTVTAK